VAFVGLALLSIGLMAAAYALPGRDVAGLPPRFIAIALVPPFSLALQRHLARVASEALDRFRPLLDGATEIEDLRYRLMVAPRREVLVVWALTTWGTVSNAVVAPANFEIVGLGPVEAAVLVGYACLVGFSYSTLVLQVVRQLALVDRIHREAARVNLLDASPLQAFSRLTAQASLGLLTLAAVLATTTLPEFAAASTSEVATALAAGLYVAIAVAAVAAFVLPLYGLHRRIATEKERLETEAGARLTSLLAALHADAAGLDLSRADGLNKLLGSAFAEREVLARLPTWPWQAATIRAFASALLLPVVIYVLARATERLVL